MGTVFYSIKAIAVVGHQLLGVKKKKKRYQNFKFTRHICHAATRRRRRKLFISIIWDPLHEFLLHESLFSTITLVKSYRDLIFSINLTLILASSCLCWSFYSNHISHSYRCSYWLYYVKLNHLKLNSLLFLCYFYLLKTASIL